MGETNSDLLNVNLNSNWVVLSLCRWQQMSVMSLLRGSAGAQEKPGTNVMDCYPETSGQGSNMILKTLWEWHKEVKLESDDLKPPNISKEDLWICLIFSLSFFSAKPVSVASPCELCLVFDTLLGCCVAVSSQGPIPNYKPPVFACSRRSLDSPSKMVWNVTQSDDHQDVSDDHIASHSLRPSHYWYKD